MPLLSLLLMDTSMDDKPDRLSSIKSVAALNGTVSSKYSTKLSSNLFCGRKLAMATITNMLAGNNILRLATTKSENLSIKP